jgi:hypothetical protein
MFTTTSTIDTTTTTASSSIVKTYTDAGPAPIHFTLHARALLFFLFTEYIRIYKAEKALDYFAIVKR